MFIAGTKHREQAAPPQKTQTLLAFTEEFLKATFGVRVAAPGLSSGWLVGTEQESASSAWFLPVPALALVAVGRHCPRLEGLWFLQKGLNACVRLFCVSL